MTPLDFSQLSLKDALDLAILVEDESRERYEEFTRLLTRDRTLDTAGFFRFMADTEGRHGDELRKRRRKLFRDAPREVSPARLEGAEAPERGAARAGMTPREALEVALRAEQRAQGFFRSALAHIHNGRVRALFQELRDEEVHHEELVRGELMRLPLERAAGQGSLVGEPGP